MQGLVVGLKLLCTISFRIDGENRALLIMTNFSTRLLKVYIKYIYRLLHFLKDIQVFLHYYLCTILILIVYIQIKYVNYLKKVLYSLFIIAYPAEIIRSFSEVLSGMKVSDVLTVLIYLF